MEYTWSVTTCRPVIAEVETPGEARPIASETVFRNAASR